MIGPGFAAALAAREVGVFLIVLISAVVAAFALGAWLF